MQTLIHQTSTNHAQPESIQTQRTYKQHIGSTDFEVSVYFSATSRETLADKVTRLIKSETMRKERESL